MAGTRTESEAVRMALRRAERDVRLSYLQVALYAGLLALTVGVAFRVADLSQPVHLLILLLGAFLCLETFLLATVFSARQDAVNARLLRALELIDERKG